MHGKNSIKFSGTLGFLLGILKGFILYSLRFLNEITLFNYIFTIWGLTARKIRSERPATSAFVVVLQPSSAANASALAAVRLAR